MTTEKGRKINRLLRVWPSGTVAVQPWLSHQGISANLTNWYLKANWLEPIGRGAYKKPGDQISWSGGLYTIQQHLQKKVHVGGKSALGLLGYSHYLYLGKKSTFDLFADAETLLPAWFKQIDSVAASTKFFSSSLFQNYSDGLVEKVIDGNIVILAGTERAMMETLYLIPKHQTLDEAYLLMAGLQGMRPKVVQQLLENCRSAKVKRLFMHLAELHNLPFLPHVNLDNIDFGKGKRVILGGGIYHKKYQLSLPEIKEGYN